MYKIALVHGAWGSPRIMESLSVGLQKLADTEVTSVQLAGHGGEAFTPEMGRYGLEDYENDILAKLPDGKIIIVGHSMGAVCGFNLAQKYPEKVGGAVMIDPPMLGGASDIRVTKALMSKPLRYLVPLFMNGLFTPTREDAKLMLYNDKESPHIEDIIHQPAAGRVIRQMLTGRLPRQSKQPCAVVIAGGSRLHPSKPKVKWSQTVHALCENFWDQSHCDILESTHLSQVVSNLVAHITL